jgi:hypothetical protein
MENWAVLRSGYIQMYVIDTVHFLKTVEKSETLKPTTCPHSASSCMHCEHALWQTGQLQCVMYPYMMHKTEPLLSPALSHRAEV